MSSEQLGGLVRTVLAIFGGFVLNKGWVGAETWTWIVGGAASAIPAFWSWYSNRPAGIAASAQGLKGVDVTASAAAGPAVVAAVAAAK